MGADQRALWRRDHGSCAIDSHLFAGVRGSGIYHSTNSARMASGQFRVYESVPLGVFVDGTNLMSGTEEGGAFLSTDIGAHWTAVTPAFHGTHMSFVCPQRNESLCGNSAGVFHSPNQAGRAGLRQFWIGEHNVNALAVIGSDLFAGTMRPLSFYSDGPAGHPPPLDCQVDPCTHSRSKGTDLLAGSGGRGSISLVRQRRHVDSRELRSEQPVCPQRFASDRSGCWQDIRRRTIPYH